MSKILAQGMITLTQLYEGAQVILTPSAVLIPCDSKEAPKPNAYVNAFTNVRAFLGTMDITSKITLGTLEYSDSTVKASKTGTKVSITAITTRTGYVDIPVSVTIDGETIDLGKHRFSFVKQIDGQTGQTGAQGAPGFSYTLNIKGGTRGVAYAANGTNPEPKTSSQFSVELLKNGVKIDNPASISWTCGGNLSGSSSAATFTPTIKSTYNSESSYVKVSVKEFAASLAVEETIPIVCTKHADGLDWINEWNNQYVQVGTEKIITPKIFAGTKNSANELTGVAIGRDVLGGNANKVIGIVGYKKNTPVFSLDQDANFFVSSSGSAGDVKNGTNNAKGIYFDGNNLYVSGRVRISGGSTIGENNTSVEDVINNSNLGVQANNKLNNLSIGGRNLIRKADLAQNNSTATYDGATNTWTINATAGGGGTWGCGLVVKNKNALVPYGKSYVLSFEIKVPRACSWNCDVNNYALTGSSWSGNDNDVTSKRTTSSKSLAANQWIKCWIKWENTNSNNTNKVDIYDNSNFGVVMKDETSNMTYQIRNVKGELGNVPTEWTPAPEDVQADIDKKANSSDVYKKTETYTKTQTDSAIEVAKNEINLGVSSTYETKTNVESKISTANTTTLNSAKSYADTKKNEAISSASTDATNKVNSAKNELNTKINDIQVGGRNLFLNSGFTNGVNYWYGYNCSKLQAVADSSALSGYAVKFTSTGGGIYQRKGGVPNNPTNYPNGSVMTVSGYVKSSVANKVLRPNFENGGTNTSKNITCTNADTWYYFTHTHKISSNGFSTITFYGDSGADYYLKDVMFEYGNKASTWTLAPEDVAANIDTAKAEAINSANSTLTTTIANYYTKEQTNSQINIAKEAINLGVSNTYETKANVETKINAIQVGSRNWVQNSAFKSTAGWILSGGWSVNSSEKFRNNNSVYINRSGLTADSWSELRSNKISVKQGDKLVGSWYIKYRDCDMNSLVELWGYKADGSGRVSIANSYQISGTNANWTRYVLKGTVPANVDYVQLAISHRRNGIIYAAMPQVEYGNTATDWSPAPEDTTADINTAKNEAINSANNTLTTTIANYYTKEQTNSQINIAKNEINLGVSNTYETKTNVETKVSSAKTEAINTASTDATNKVNSAKNELNTTINNIQVGGVNRLTGTATSKNTNVNVPTSYVTFDPYTTPNKQTLEALGFKVGDKVTISFDWSISQNGSNAYTYGNFRLEFKGINSAGTDNQYVGLIKNPVATFSSSNTKGTEAITTTLNSSTIKAHTLRFRIDNSVLNFKVSNVKLEKGNKSTTWSPAPEDVTADIANAKTEAINSANSTLTTTIANYYTKAQTDSQINVAKDAINLGVSNTYETKTNVETKVSTAKTEAINTSKSYADTKKNEAISTASTDATNKVNSAKSELNGKIDNIQIGGRNLLPKKSLNLSNGASGTFDSKTNTWTLVASKGSSSWGRGLSISSPNSIVIPFGQCATYSFEIKVPKAISWNFDVNNTPVSGSAWSNNDNDNTGARKTSNKSLTKVNEWIKCWAYVENTSTSNTNKVDIKDANSNFGIVTTNETSDITYYIRNVKVELGNKATDWSPCPEDVDSAINSKANSNDVYKKTEVYTRDETNSQINVAKNDITLAVSNTYETKTNVENKVNNAVNNIKVGGRNLILNSALNGNKNWTGTVAIDTSKKYENCNSLKYTGVASSYSSSTPAKAGDVFTISLKSFVGTSGGNLPLIIFEEYKDNTTNRINYQETAVSSTLNSWQPYTKTWTVKNSETTNVRVRIYNRTASYNSWISQPKLERGTKATDWSPAPEDVDSAISAVDNKVNSANTNISNLTTRVTTAESKLTKDSLTTTIGNHYTTKTDVDGIVTSKGYQTQSQVQQTVDGLQVKVQQSGGYNLLRNSGFKKDSLHWGTQSHNSPTGGSIGYLNHTAEWGFPNANVKCCQIRLSNQTNKEYGIAQTFNTTIGKKYTISFYYAGHRVPRANMIIRGTSSSTGAWLTNKIFVPTSKNGGNSSVNNWELFTHTFTATLNSHTLNIVINDANDNGYMWIAQPMIEEGELYNPYSPHSSEVYDGITAIDKDGITVTSSNVKSKTQMSANGFKITKTDTNEDVFKVNSDGTLVIKGNITVTGGSIPTSNLSGTISSSQLNSSITTDITNAKNNASTALSTANTASTNATNAVNTANTAKNTADSVNNTLNSNKVNWNNAYERVKQWASGAITGSTNINGGMIATDTITAKQMAIGDFNNYSQLAKGKNLVSRYGTANWVEGTNSHSFWKTTNEYFPFTVNETLNPFKAGDKIQIKFDAYTPSARNVNVGVWFYSGTSADSYLGHVAGTVSCSSSWGTKTVNLTLPTGNTYVQNAKSIAILIQNGSSGESIEVRNATVNRLVAGDLIVNGTITTDHIHTNGLNANVIKAGTISADRLDANTIVSKVNGGTTEINGNRIQTGTLSASKITTGTLDASKISVTNLNASNITSGTLKGRTIEGGTISNGSTVIDNTGLTVNNGAIKIKNKAGNTVLSGDSNGNLTLNGTIKSEAGNGLYVALNSGGITFKDSQHSEEVLRIGTSFSNGNRDINGVTFAMPQYSDRISFRHIAKPSLENGWDGSETSYTFMEMWSTDYNHSNGKNYKGVNVFAPMYLSQKIRFRNGGDQYLHEVTPNITWNNMEKLMGVYGDNGTVIGYKSADSLHSRIVVTEGNHPNTGDSIRSWGNWNCTGATVHNATFNGRHVNSYTNTETRTICNTAAVMTEGNQVRVNFENVQIKDGKAILSIPKRYRGINEGYTIASIVKKGRGDVWVSEEEEERFIIEAENDIKINIEIIIKLTEAVVARTLKHEDSICYEVPNKQPEGDCC